MPAFISMRVAVLLKFLLASGIPAGTSAAPPLKVDEEMLKKFRKDQLCKDGKLALEKKGSNTQEEALITLARTYCKNHAHQPVQGNPERDTGAVNMEKVDLPG
ncbi:MAG: hypothetical protein M3O22_02895 [Pseudomonadota bacterium]|nr:hypothetical protein [Pseudomonadota bacterium]